MKKRLIVDNTPRWRAGVKHEWRRRARISRGRSGIRYLLHEAFGSAPHSRNLQQSGLPLVRLFGRAQAGSGSPSRSAAGERISAPASASRTPAEHVGQALLMQGGDITPR